MGVDVALGAASGLGSDCAPFEGSREAKEFTLVLKFDEKERKRHSLGGAKNGPSVAVPLVARSGGGACASGARGRSCAPRAAAARMGPPAAQIDRVGEWKKLKITRAMQESNLKCDVRLCLN